MPPPRTGRRFPAGSAALQLLLLPLIGRSEHDGPLDSADASAAWSGELARATEARFDDYVGEQGFLDDLTPEELERYRSRFVARAQRKARLMDLTSSEQAADSPHWQQRVATYLHEEQPVVTERLADRANLAAAGWSAQVKPWQFDMSLGVAKGLMGYIADHSIIQDLERAELEGNGSASARDGSLEARRLLSELPESFDSRKRWSKCSEVINHVRDQGKCGSCWAQAAAGSLDGRLCIATDGKFSGPDAWTSAGYITSCYPMPRVDGCMGGNPGWALSKMMPHSDSLGGGGVPTGNLGSRGTCVPYFASGDSLSHFDGRNPKAPRCPSRCTGKGYARSLHDDKFYTAGMPGMTTRLVLVKREVYLGGPAPMAFTVYRDFMAYSSGRYSPTTKKEMGGHATTLIGWEQFRDEDYLLSVNSWGTRWGESGKFRLRATCCSVTYFVARVPSEQKALPFPAAGSAGSGLGHHSALSSGHRVHGRQHDAVAGDFELAAVGSVGNAVDLSLLLPVLLLVFFCTSFCCFLRSRGADLELDLFVSQASSDLELSPSRRRDGARRPEWLRLSTPTAAAAE
eukprot:TRINITY_DN30617_c0_g1_i1.p1 TRINITY_DN30617_c0_g1~~TRINITY_DN30617_c0_g1_i1.p1  ORF type:complete len:572 (+),score=126.66 TRINITY_DN30617_c0_g1_i1:111-1826(+)